MTMTYIIGINLFRTNSVEVTFNLHSKGFFVPGWCWKWSYILIPTLKISWFHCYVTTQPRVRSTVRMPPTLVMLPSGAFCLSKMSRLYLTGLYDAENGWLTLLLAMASKACGPSLKDKPQQHHFQILLCFLKLWYYPPIVKSCLSNNMTSQHLWGILTLAVWLNWE